jgi:hypothetical protein
MTSTASEGLDLDAVDELCRMALAAVRLGCRVTLVDVDAGLRELLVLAGVDGVLLDDQPADEGADQANPRQVDLSNIDRDDRLEERDLP